MDYPAAHSMDSSWYAVDKCGHVATFSTGPEGAMPAGVDSDESCPLHFDDPLPGEVEACIGSGDFVLGTHETKISTWEGRSYAFGFHLLGPGVKGDRTNIRPSAPTAKDPSPEEPRFGTTDGRDWVEGEFSPETWTWLHAAPDRCLGCQLYLPIDYDRRDRELRVFTFDCDGYSTPPYERVHLPENPATLEEVRKQLPVPIPDPPVTFTDFCFRDKPILQPMQWIEAHGWSLEWTDEEGKEHSADETPT